MCVQCAGSKGPTTHRTRMAGVTFLLRCAVSRVMTGGPMGSGPPVFTSPAGNTHSGALQRMQPRKKQPHITLLTWRACFSTYGGFRSGRRLIGRGFEKDNAVV